MTLSEYLLFKNGTIVINDKVMPNPFPSMVNHFDRIIWTLDYMILETNKNIKKLQSVN